MTSDRLVKEWPRTCMSVAANNFDQEKHDDA